MPLKEIAHSAGHPDHRRDPFFQSEIAYLRQRGNLRRLHREGTAPVLQYFFHRFLNDRPITAIGIPVIRRAKKNHRGVSPINPAIRPFLRDRAERKVFINKGFNGDIHTPRLQQHHGTDTLAAGGIVHQLIDIGHLPGKAAPGIQHIVPSGFFLSCLRKIGRIQSLCAQLQNRRPVLHRFQQPKAKNQPCNQKEKNLSPIYFFSPPFSHSVPPAFHRKHKRIGHKKSA